MPGYIKSALQKYYHKKPRKNMHHMNVNGIYRLWRLGINGNGGITLQPIYLDMIKLLKRLVGNLLFNGRAIDITILVLLGKPVQYKQR